jgi:hypothetical protein
MYISLGSQREGTYFAVVEIDFSSELRSGSRDFPSD